MRFSIRSLLLLVASVAFVVAFAIHCFGPVFPESTVARIRAGDTQQQVLDLLGKPNANSTDSSWYYDRALNPGWLTVNFDSIGNVTYVDHERAFP